MNKDIEGYFWKIFWSGRRDSNPRHQPWQGCTLPLSYARFMGESSFKLCVFFIAHPRKICNIFFQNFFPMDPITINTKEITTIAGPVGKSNQNEVKAPITKATIAIKLLIMTIFSGERAK